MPLPGFMKCCARTEEAESHHIYSFPTSSNYEMTDSEAADILNSSISRSGFTPKRQCVKLPTPKEADTINQEMIRAMENYRKRIHAQHIHHFLKFSRKKPRRRSTVTKATMTNDVDATPIENKSEPVKVKLKGKPITEAKKSQKKPRVCSQKDGPPVEGTA